jgi:hypothetical protein
MTVAPVLWLLITAGGAALPGVVVMIGLVTTRRRRENVDRGRNARDVSDGG